MKNIRFLKYELKLLSKRNSHYYLRQKALKVKCCNTVWNVTLVAWTLGVITPHSKAFCHLYNKLLQRLFVPILGCQCWLGKCCLLPQPGLQRHRDTVYRSITPQCLNKGLWRRKRWGETKVIRGKRERNEDRMWRCVIFSHQVGHDVMVAFHVFPDADDLQGGGAQLSVNLSGLQHAHVNCFKQCMWQACGCILTQWDRWV